ncbi:hypothetical protein RMSM_05668 [Rhodopirellula maiorica SM1]|uniref:Uncharacterized protein n=1 Tax=Rhodopirellula maiorica SM1 TaxID=1265738 RepID=M5RTZ0_9BACT|nr:hypothetical protein [Rhodopirellula maiorica]EMI17439.1 hypothetical protein RMSM_05668 [Rhodopirellula maiorica SM1]
MTTPNVQTVHGVSHPTRDEAAKNVPDDAAEPPHETSTQKYREETAERLIENNEAAREQNGD